MLAWLLLFSSLASQDVLTPEQLHTFELTPEAPVQELRYRMQTSDAFVWVYVESDAFDPTLRIQVPAGAGSHLLRRYLEAGEWVEDDDSGGGTTALIQLEMLQGGELRIEVRAKEPGASGVARIHVAESIENAQTRPAGLAAMQAIQEAQGLHRSGDLDGARARLKEALSQLRAIEGADRSLPVEFMTEEIAYALQGLGDIESSLRAFEFCLAEQTRIQPRSSRSLLAIQRNFANLCTELGRYDEAARLLEAGLAVLIAEPTPDEQTILPTKNGLGSTWVLMGRIQEGRDLLEQIHAQLVAAGRPDQDPDLLSVRSNLAVALTSIGDFEGAHVLLERVFAVAEKVFPDDSPQLQVARLNLAASLKNVDRDAEARPLEEKMLEIYERTLPEDHPTLLLARLNLAATLKALGEVDAGLAMQKQVLERQLATLPDEHPELQLTRFNVSLTLAARGQLDEARKLQEKLVEVARRTQPVESTSYQSGLAVLAHTLFSQGDVSAYRAIVPELASAVQRRAGQFGALSTRELEAVPAAADEAIRTVLAMSCGAGRDEPDAECERAAFEMCESIRSSSLSAARLSRRLSSSPRTRELRAQLIAASEEVSRLAGSPDAEGRFSQALLARDRLERELMAETLGEEGAGSERAEDPREISRRLAEDEVAIAYWTYVPPAVAELPHESNLIAWVLRSGEPLLRIDLGPTRPIRETIESWRASVASASSEQESLTRRLGVALRHQVFDALSDHCQEARRVWLVPAGDLNAIPFDALPFEEGVLGDRFEIVTGNSLSGLLSKDIESAALPPSLLVMGGISYELAEEGKGRAEAGGASQSLLQGGLRRGPGFAPLPATRAEAEAVEARFRSAFPEAALSSRMGAAADRSAFERAATGCRYVHLATHAWFAPTGLSFDETARAVDDGQSLATSIREQVRGLAPSLLCGIAFAGANQPADDFGRVFGVMTGEELQALDLTGCELAVLSACESSLGRALASQRLASLQQSLRAAGARTTITSLWKVPDEPTRLLMSELYRLLWEERLPKAQALWRAKQLLRDAKDTEGAPLYTTRDWAAWVLSGDPD